MSTLIDCFKGVLLLCLRLVFLGVGSPLFKLYTHLVKVSALHFKSLKAKQFQMSNCNENLVTKKGSK